MGGRRGLSLGEGGAKQNNFSNTHVYIVLDSREMI